MDIISRSAAGLPSPSVLSRRTTPWTGKTWHHTGGNYTTWKAIHDWQTDGRPEADELVYIGYSYGIRNGRATELRGWDYRAAGDHDNSRVQICFMGTYDKVLPSAADLACARELDRYLDERAGRRLPNVAHRDVWPSGHRYDTDCPGNALYAWVRANLATPAAGEDDDMDMHTLVTAAVFPLEAPKQSLGSTWLATFQDVRKLVAESAADKARDEATLAAVNALAEAIRAGGGSVDSAAIVSAVNGVGDRVLAKIEAEVNELRDENADLRTRLAAALAAE
jgi:hypothetical protein